MVVNGIEYRKQIEPFSSEPMVYGSRLRALIDKS